MQRRQLLASLAAVSFVPGMSFAQEGKPLRMIVPFPPGGATDITARTLQDALARILKQPVVLENRGGAGGSIGMAEVARAQGLQGKAIRLYKEALLLDPTDIVALSGQGEAMVEKGAVARAKEVLAEAQKLCKADCAPVTRLSAAIQKGPPVVALTAKDTIPAPKSSPTETP